MEPKLVMTEAQGMVANRPNLLSEIAKPGNEHLLSSFRAEDQPIGRPTRGGGYNNYQNDRPPRSKFVGSDRAADMRTISAFFEKKAPIRGTITVYREDVKDGKVIAVEENNPIVRIYKTIMALEYVVSEEGRQAFPIFLDYLGIKKGPGKLKLVKPKLHDWVGKDPCGICGWDGHDNRTCKLCDRDGNQKLVLSPLEYIVGATGTFHMHYKDVCRRFKALITTFLEDKSKYQDTISEEIEAMVINFVGHGDQKIADKYRDPQDDVKGKKPVKKDEKKELKKTGPTLIGKDLSQVYLKKTEGKANSITKLKRKGEELNKQLQDKKNLKEIKEIIEEVPEKDEDDEEKAEAMEIWDQAGDRELTQEVEDFKRHLHNKDRSDFRLLQAKAFYQGDQIEPRPGCEEAAGWFAYVLLSIMENPMVSILHQTEVNNLHRVIFEDNMMQEYINMVLKTPENALINEFGFQGSEAVATRRELTELIWVKNTVKRIKELGVDEEKMRKKWIKREIEKEQKNPAIKNGSKKSGKTPLSMALDDIGLTGQLLPASAQAKPEAKIPPTQIQAQEGKQVLKIIAQYYDILWEECKNNLNSGEELSTNDINETLAGLQEIINCPVQPGEQITAYISLRNTVMETVQKMNKEEFAEIDLAIDILTVGMAKAIEGLDIDQGAITIRETVKERIGTVWILMTCERMKEIERLTNDIRDQRIHPELYYKCLKALTEGDKSFLWIYSLILNQLELKEVHEKYYEDGRKLAGDEPPIASPGEKAIGKRDNSLDDGASNHSQQRAEKARKAIRSPNEEYIDIPQPMLRPTVGVVDPQIGIISERLRSFSKARKLIQSYVQQAELEATSQDNG